MYDIHKDPRPDFVQIQIEARRERARYLNELFGRLFRKLFRRGKAGAGGAVSA